MATVSSVALIVASGTGLPPTVAPVIFLPGNSGDRIRIFRPPGGGLAAKRDENVTLTW